jgi:hypothetical protein
MIMHIFFIIPLHLGKKCFFSKTTEVDTMNRLFRSISWLLITGWCTWIIAAEMPAEAMVQGSVWVANEGAIASLSLTQATTG